MLVIFRSGCVDKLDNCKDYGQAACTTYKPWAEDNCMNTCKFCVGKFYWFIFFSFFNFERCENKWREYDTCM